MIEIEVTVKNLAEAFAALERGLRDATPLMKEIAFVMNDAVAENFEQGGRPTWLGKKSGGPSKLQDTGRLKSSIVRYYDQSSATVGTNVVYAAIHQLGGKTPPHTIRAKNAKALHFGNRFVKSVRHPGSKIPARPFLDMTEEDSTELELVAEKYLRGLVE